MDIDILFHHKTNNSLIVVTLVILLFGLFLVGCEEKHIYSKSPEEALYEIYGKENMTEIYATHYVNNDQVISVHKGRLGYKEDVIIAHIEKRDDGWIATEAVSIGPPSPDTLHISPGTNSMKAGYMIDDSIPGENLIILELKDSIYSVWVELLD